MSLRWLGGSLKRRKDPDLRLRPERSDNVGCRHPRIQIETPPFTWEGASHFAYTFTISSCHLNIQPRINSTQANPSAHHRKWPAPNDPQRPLGRQLPTQRSRQSKCVAWKKPASKPKPSAPNTSKTNNRAHQPAPKMPRLPPKSQAKNVQRPQPSHPPSEMPVATPAAWHRQTTPPSAPRANSRNSSTTTSAK